jgi:hypothetical protein
VSDPLARRKISKKGVEGKGKVAKQTELQTELISETNLKWQ